ncbi:MAG: hypothetical protein ACYC25_17760, partial [Paludibacter sp.]
TFDCIPESRNIFTKDLVEKITYCCNDYIGDVTQRIIEVDISKTNDTLNIWVIENLFTSLNRRHPDGFIRLKNNLAFLYSDNYTIVKDTVWLENLYSLGKTNTCRTTYSMVSWDKNIYQSIDYINPNYKELADEFNPRHTKCESTPLKYVFVNGAFKTKKMEWQTIHSDYLFPKNVDEPWMWENEKIYIKNKRMSEKTIK